MEKVKVQVLISEGVTLPKYETSGSAGMDVRANISEPIVLGSLERVLVPTGIKMAIPEEYEVQVRPRSGLALNKVAQMDFEVVESLDETERGAGGFGHTGK